MGMRSELRVRGTGMSTPLNSRIHYVWVFLMLFVMRPFTWNYDWLEFIPYYGNFMANLRTDPWM
jgi:hypothetical protein